MVLALLVLLFVSGCKTTGKAATDVCDDSCQQGREEYIKEINTFRIQAQEITVKVDEWKTITKKDLEDVTTLRDQVSALNAPTDFDMVHDYYQRAFNHYVEAIDYAVKANEEYALASDPSNIETHNMAMSKVINNVQEANKILIYAEEEVKFATRIISKS